MLATILLFRRQKKASLLRFTQPTRKAIVNRRNAIGLANSSGWLALAIHSRQRESSCLARILPPNSFRAYRFVTLQIFSPWLVPRQSALCYDSNSHERSQVVLARHTPTICHSPLGCLLRCNPEQIVQAVVYPRLSVMRKVIRPVVVSLAPTTVC